MPEQQITGFPVRAAPNSRVTKDSESFELLAVNATFDGSGAGGDFLPAVEVVSDSGVVVARHVAEETVAAGGAAEVTFAPFLRSLRGFIRYVFANAGEWLSIHTTGSGGPDGKGIALVATDAILLDAGSFLTLTDVAGLNINSGGIVIFCSGGMSETVDSGYAGDYGNGAGGPFPYQLNVGGEFDLTAGSGVFLNLPLAPGAAGSLWNDAGSVKVA